MQTGKQKHPSLNLWQEDVASRPCDVPQIPGKGRLARGDFSGRLPVPDSFNRRVWKVISVSGTGSKVLRRKIDSVRFLSWREPWRRAVPARRCQNGQRRAGTTVVIRSRVGPRLQGQLTAGWVGLQEIVEISAKGVNQDLEEGGGGKGILPVGTTGSEAPGRKCRWQLRATGACAALPRWAADRGDCVGCSCLA